MEKIQAFKRGQVWLNLFRTNSGDLAVTIAKSYPAGDGHWRRTNVFLPSRGDIGHLQEAFEDFYAFLEKHEQEGSQ